MNSLCLLSLTVLDVVIAKHVGPERGHLMCVVDLHDVELLDDFLVNLDFTGLERGDHLLTKVDGDEVMQLVQTFDFLVSLNC